MNNEPPPPTVLTVDEVIEQCCKSPGICYFKPNTADYLDTMGSRVLIDQDRLRTALEAAYDPTAPDWPSRAVMPV